MTNLKQFAISALAAMMTTLILSAQTPQPGAAPQGRGGRGTPAPAVRSPEVNPDRTVTFRLRAPQAAAVELVGEVLQGKGPQAMTKDSDGVWSVTIGPLPPEIWIYNFRIDGVSLPDPANISQMPRAAGTAISSFVEVSGDAPAFYDTRPVPHGEVRMVLYESKAMGVDRYMWVYTPPGYDKSNAKYPVFYLLHGNGETQSGWVMNGRANIILDNLIADGKAVPMVVVMPHGHPIQSASVGPFAVVPPKGSPGMGNFTLFTEDLLGQIIPTIEKDFRVYTDADHRAIGGLSMGAMQSIAIGLSHLELFHYVLAYSGGFGSLGTAPATTDIETQSPWKDLLANPAETKKRLRLLFLGCGQQETGLLAPGQRLVKLFKEKGINAEWADYPGGHVFSVWRNDLNTSAPMLFHSRSYSRTGTERNP
jgi:enterochelin esterase-like enzyme